MTIRRARWQRSEGPQSQSAKRAGFTLVEVTISAAVIAVLAMAASAAFVGSMRGVNEASKMAEAAVFLDTTFENISTQPYDNLLALNGNRIFDGTDATDSKYAIDLATFVSQVDLIQIDGRIVDLATDRELGRSTALRSKR